MIMTNYYDWQSKVQELVPDNMRIGDDLLILEFATYNDSFNVPRKVDVTTLILLDKGESRAIVEGKEYHLKAPCLAIVMPNQTYCLLEASEELNLRAIIMSNRFTANLMSSSLNRMVQKNPILEISSDIISFNTYYKVLLHAVKSPIKSYRLETAQHLTMSMLYFYTRNLVKIENDKKRKEVIFDNFCEELRKHFSINRTIPFYSGRLGVSPKYLNDIVKEKTQITANDYIDKVTVTECKALLSSTEMSIQRISMLMNFSSYSGFGKFFKRMTGMSPTEYRERTK
jgi:AraC-like DNA-binding protein